VNSTPFSSMDVEIDFSFDLASGASLDAIQTLIRDSAPTWSSSLRIWHTRNRQTPIDIGQEGALRREVKRALSYHGPTYEAMTERLPVEERRAGAIELRGGSTELIIIIEVDELPFAPAGRALLFGNRISFQIRRSKVENCASYEWSEAILLQACSSLQPAWAGAWTPEEYVSKVMAASEVSDAIGRDISRYIPGLFWLNFFGAEYCNFIGEETLLSVPCEARRVGSGVLIKLDARPAWNTPSYRRAESATLRHIGREFFFDRNRSPQITKAPLWGPVG